MRKQPNFWVKAHLTKYPTAGETLLTMSNRAMQGPGWIEGRLTSQGTVDRSASDESGAPVRGRASINFVDADRRIRTLMADTENKYLQSREVEFFLQSEEQRLVAATPEVFFTGLIRQTPLADRMAGSFVMDDWLGSRRSPFSNEKKIGGNRKITRDIWPQVAKELIGKMQPIVIGDLSDEGVVDETGNPADVGAVVAIPVGARFIAGIGGGPEPEGVEIRYITPPVNLSYSIVGTPGSTTYRYAISAISGTGETLASTTLVITNGPTQLSELNYIVLNWSLPPEGGDQVIAYRVMGRFSTQTYLGLTTNNGSFVNPETTFTDIGFQSPQSGSAPTSPTAVLQAYVPGSDFEVAEVWQTFLVCGHAINPDHIHDVYFPDWDPGQEPERRKVPSDDAYGVDILVPGKPNWPFPTPYVDFVDQRTGDIHRCTVIFARGPRALYAMQGKAGYALNMCGIEDVGDGTGEPIRKAAFALQWVLDEMCAANDGKGYFSGTWAGLPYFKSNPTLSLIDTDSIQQTQDDTIALIGGVGYVMDTIIDEEVSVGDFITAFNNQYQTKNGTNRFGQFRLWLPDRYRTAADVAAAVIYREGTDIIRMDPPDPNYDTVENKWSFTYWYNFEKKEFRNDIETLDQKPSQDAYLDDVREVDVVEMKLIADRVTARNVMGRRRSRRAFHQVYQTITTGMIGLRSDLGDVIRIIHREGLGSAGWDAYFIVSRVVVNIDVAEVTLTGQYIGAADPAGSLAGLPTVLGYGVPLLGDETGSDAILLGDETSTEPPPVGAYLLE